MIEFTVAQPDGSWAQILDTLWIWAKKANRHKQVKVTMGRPTCLFGRGSKKNMTCWPSPCYIQAPLFPKEFFMYIKKVCSIILGKIS